ncbi:hypothetical protein N5U22_00870 [Aliarcobacter cryaerophilus]|uniref:hypothetical protein n=1 Tax=Aliarcobacter cryaerophilus TaxID=28198 RepID=UPI000DEBA2FC|nr:hypothetical protein [Aliarcobacter cryaerophilus]MCT7531954.1 hypothetical protein [Aliarcobacter cryaerophilus]RBQ31233.1 hypothetical protein CRU92_08660 [Arcobacter sp. FW59]
MSKLDFCKNVVLNISSGVVGGCIVSFFLGEINAENFDKLIWIIILTSFALLVIGFIGRNQNPTNQDEKVDEKGEK